MKVLFSNRSRAGLWTFPSRGWIAEAMERYGSDKPDLRFELPMEELTPLFRVDRVRSIQEGGGVREGR